MLVASLASITVQADRGVGATGARLERVTRPLLGAPYVRSPLGEGFGVDPDPRFRLDAFDCTTFVETALALAASGDRREARAALDRIRYQGDRVAFKERRHFVTSQWLPGLLELGILEDVTASVGGEFTDSIRLKLDERRWRRRRVARTLKLPLSDVPFGRFSIPFVPIEIVLDRLEHIPPGTVVNVVRAESRASYDVVTHQGLIVVRPTDGALVVRHASPVAKRVIDEPIHRLVTRYRRPRKWPVVGLNFARVISPSGASGADERQVGASKEGNAPIVPGVD